MAIYAPPVSPMALRLPEARPAVLFFLAMSALLLLGAERLLNDPDTQWHIAVGRDILRTGIFPTVDSYSHTFRGMPWIAKEWLSQVILFLSYDWMGWSGVALLSAIVLSSSFAALFQWLAPRSGIGLALALAGISACLAAPQFLARPHMFLPMLLVIWVGNLLRAAEGGTAPPFALLAVMALWANLHASFPIGLALAGAIALEAIVSAAPAERRRVTLLWLAFGASSLLVCGATPYGFGPLLVNFRLFGSGEAFRYISEWQPLKLDSIGIVGLALLAASVIVLLLDRRASLLRLLPLALAATLMIQHLRFTGLFGIVAVMLIAAPLARVCKRIPLEAGASRRGSLAAPAALGLALVCAWLALTMRVQPNPAMTPAGALWAARALGLNGPVFNDHDFGGYLIAQGVPTFVDGRTDQLFIDGFLGRLFQSAARPDQSFIAFVQSYGATWALVRPGSDEAARFASAPNWLKLYQDEVASLYKRVG